MATAEQFDQWKTGMGVKLESDAEQAAANINSHIADSLDLTAMDVLAVADEEEGTVTLYVGEYHCGSYPPRTVLGCWPGAIAISVSKACSEALRTKETTNG